MLHRRRKNTYKEEQAAVLKSKRYRPRKLVSLKFHRVWESLSVCESFSFNSLVLVDNNKSATSSKDEPFVLFISCPMSSTSEQRSRNVLLSWQCQERVLPTFPSSYRTCVLHFPLFCLPTHVGFGFYLKFQLYPSHHPSILLLFS